MQGNNQQPTRRKSWQHEDDEDIQDEAVRASVVRDAYTMGRVPGAASKEPGDGRKENDNERL